MKPVLGLGAVTFIAVGMTIGGGVFVFTGITLKITGKALPLAYLLAVAPVFVAMMPLAMLGATIPTTGGNYRYPSRMVSPGLAFTGIWIYALASFFGQIPLYALGCARYVQAVVPGIPETLFAIGLVTFFFAVNYFGVQVAARVQGALVVVLCAALLGYAATGTIRLHPEHFHGLLERGGRESAAGHGLADLHLPGGPTVSSNWAARSTIRKKPSLGPFSSPFPWWH